MRNRLAEEYRKEWEKIKELNRISKIENSFREEKEKLLSLYEDIFLQGVLKSDRVKLFEYDSSKKKGNRWSGCYIEGKYRKQGIVVGRRIGKMSRFSSQADYKQAGTDFELKAIKKFGDRIAEELSNYDNKKENMRIFHEKMKNYLDIDWELERKYDKRTGMVLPKANRTYPDELKRYEMVSCKLKIDGSGNVSLKIQLKNGSKVKCKFPIKVFDYTDIFALSQYYDMFKRWIKLGVEYYKKTVEIRAKKVRKELINEFKSQLVKKGL